MKPGMYKTVLAVVVVALCFLAIGRTPADPSTVRAAAMDPMPTVATLRQERLAALREARDIAERQFVSGTATFEQVARLSDQLIDAELALATTPQQRAEILTNAVNQAKKEELITQKRLDADTATALEPLEAKAQRLALEIRQNEEHADKGQHR